MLLGGTHYVIPLIEIAHQYGMYVITADYLPSNVAHKYADEYCNVNIVDKEKTLEEARKRKIDGIMSFACDPGVITAAYVAEKMNLPTVGPFESVEILQNKGKFRKFLQDNGFNVPNARSYHTYKEIEEDIEAINFPVIVKPTDSAGSKGVTKVNNKEQLKEAVNTALTVSISKEFIIEDYIVPEGHPSDTDSFSLNGELVYTSFNTQLFDEKASNPYVPAAFYWGSTYSDEQKEYLKAELQRLISLLKMNTAIYNIETRIGCNGLPYIMEMSPRGGGNRLAEMLNRAYGVDLIKAAICSCVGMKVEEKWIKESSNICIFEYILHANREGVFEDVIIDSDLEKYVIEKDIWVDKGEEIKKFTGANNTLGTIVFFFPSKNILENKVEKIFELIEVKII